MAVGEEPAVAGEVKAVGKMAAGVGGEAKSVGKAPAVTDSRGPAEVAVEVAVAVEADAVEVAMEVEVGGRPSIAMKNLLL